jgi:hypothetical protein
MKAPPPVAPAAPGEQARDDAALAVPEQRLAVFGENLGDRHRGRPLDLLVGIDERQPEAGAEAPADGGFAATHEADQDHGAVAQRLAHAGDHLAVRGCLLIALGSGAAHRVKLACLAAARPFGRERK